MKKNLTTAVIVTIKNDPLGLQTLLQDLSKQTHLPTEVILVFAGMDQKSEQALNASQGKLPVTFFVLPDNATRSEARNYGVLQSKSDIILFTDAGCHPHAAWVEELLKPFSNPEVALVSGYTGVWSRSDWELAQSAFVLVSRKKIEPHPLPATRNMAILRKAFNENNGFKNELNFAEDFEFSRRLRSKGVHAVYAPKAIVLWEPRNSYQQFFSMIFKLTTGDMESKILRPGHVTMLLRYGVFVGLFLLIWSSSNVQNAVFFDFVIYVAYIFFKSYKQSELSSIQKSWYATFVPVCDMAVICGILFGLAAHTKARENRAA